MAHQGSIYLIISTPSNSSANLENIRSKEPASKGGGAGCLTEEQDKSTTRQQRGHRDPRRSAEHCQLRRCSKERSVARVPELEESLADSTEASPLPIPGEDRAKIHPDNKEARDKGLINMYTTLIYIGLLSALVYAFIIKVNSRLQSDSLTVLLRFCIYKVDNAVLGNGIPPLPQWIGPPRAMVHVQYMFFAGLVLALLATFNAMLARQWPKRCTLVGMRWPAVERSGNQQRKLNAIITCCFCYLMESLLLMLWGSPFLLRCSLSLCPWIDTTIELVICGSPSLCATFHVLATASYYVTLSYTVGWLGRQWIGLKHAVRFDKPGGWSVNDSNHEKPVPLDDLHNAGILERSPRSFGGSMLMDAGERYRNPPGGGDASVVSIRPLEPTLRKMPTSSNADTIVNAPGLCPTDRVLRQRLTSEVHVLGLQDVSVSIPSIAGPEPQTLMETHDPPIPTWRRLIGRPPLPTEERLSLVTAIFSDGDQADTADLLCEDDAQTFVDVMNETLGELPPCIQEKCLGVLRRICGRLGLLPRSIKIQPCYDQSDDPLYQGGFADVWKGRYLGDHVAVKVLRVYQTSDFEMIKKRFCKEALSWKSLRHPNVLPLLGAVMRDRHFAMVSEWMASGNINEFIRANQSVDRFELLQDIARGLVYIHSREMVHGDLKGANILIDQSGHACLADFGTLTILSNPARTMSSSSKSNAGTTRWMSPELLHPDHFGFKDSQPTKASDSYALGMVILEVLSGHHPYHELTDHVAVYKAIEGEQPERPGGPWFKDDLWRTMKQCWSLQPTDRPAIDVVLECLVQIATTLRPLPPHGENDNGASGDETISVV